MAQTPMETDSEMEVPELTEREVLMVDTLTTKTQKNLKSYVKRKAELEKEKEGLKVLNKKRKQLESTLEEDFERLAEGKQKEYVVNVKGKNIAVGYKKGKLKPVNQEYVLAFLTQKLFTEKEPLTPENISLVVKEMFSGKNRGYKDSTFKIEVE